MEAGLPGGKRAYEGGGVGWQKEAQGSKPVPITEFWPRLRLQQPEADQKGVDRRGRGRVEQTESKGREVHDRRRELRVPVRVPVSSPRRDETEPKDRKNA